MLLDGLDVIGRVGRQLGHGHLGSQLPHQGPLGRIVVGKDQRVQADIEARAISRRFAALSFQFAMKQEMSSKRRTISGCFSKTSLAIVFGILAANGQQDAALLQCLGVALEGEERLALAVALAEADAAQAVVADHAAPERVVEIQHEALLRQVPSAPPASEATLKP